MTADPSNPAGDDRARIYSGRYELIRQIARGGTAQVYLAKDLLLDRPVALKVLFPELSTDVTFVQRFRREAQAAANLSHPDIVPVFDWGESDNTYFIVMEYVDGEPLSSIIRSQAPLPAERAADIASHIAKALSYAHRHGVVHRDVKPGNVLITKDGQVKVTDFGIARAIGAEETVTQTGLVMGTATYFSPEQAQGFGVDGRSDVYALGVVLYEMVTGRPPFSADTPVAIAYKHVSELPAPARTIEPRVPEALEAVIMRALAKHPSDRYPTAEDLYNDLQRYNQGAPVAALAGAPATGAAPLTQAFTATQGVVGMPTTVLGASGAALATAPPSTFEHSTEVSGGPPGGQMPKRRWVGWAFAGLILAALLAVLVYFGGRSLGYFGGGAYVHMPKVRGEKLRSAEAKLRGYHLHVNAVARPSTSPKGQVTRQTPGTGSLVRQGSTVKLVYSSGPRTVKIPPNLYGMNYRKVDQELTALGLKPKLTPVPPAYAGEQQGLVIKTSPARGQSVKVGSTVIVDYVRGKAQVSVPSVTGDSVTKATVALAASGIQVSGRTYETSPSVRTGYVITTNPPPNSSIAVGQSVTLIISSGPPHTVPNVVGDQLPQAEAALQAAGLNFTVHYVSGPASKAGTVLSQNPPAGAQEPANFAVTLNVVQQPPNSSTTTTSSSVPPPTSGGQN